MNGTKSSCWRSGTVVYKTRMLAVTGLEHSNSSFFYLAFLFFSLFSSSFIIRINVGLD